MLKDFIKQNNIGIIYENYSLKKHTTLKIGGTCKAYIEVNTISTFKLLINYLIKNKILYFIIGNGSNLLIDDEYLDVVFISLKKLNKVIKYEDNLLLIEAGCKPQVIGLELVKKGYIDAITFSLIPGTIGGMIYMNASCFKRSINKVLKGVVCLKDNKDLILIKDFNENSYRLSIFKEKNLIILMGIFSFQEQNNEAYNKLLKYQNIKRTTQPTSLKTAGSTFKNKQNASAWELIDKANLRGFRINDAAICTLHTNFFINKNNAKFKDMLALIYYTKVVVEQKFNLKLETEIEILTTQSIAYTSYK